jgi:hypothetical protein
MGCWGFGIYQSDDAMDWEAALYREAGISEEESEMGYMVPVPALREKLEAALPRLLLVVTPRCEPGEYFGSYYNAVGYQVLATLLMAQGCTIPYGTLQAIAEGIISCPEYQLGCRLLKDSGGSSISEETYLAADLKGDGGGTTSQRIGRLTGRMAAINRLYAALQSYNREGGTPYAYRDRGLFERPI